MKVVINIPKDFEGDYIVDKFKDFFSRVIADIDCKGMCGRYEKEIAEMFLKAFDDSEEKISCNCQNNSNSRDNEPCCRCDSTLRAAAELGRSAYGFEIDRNFYERAKNEMLVFEKDSQMNISDFL
jgi:hypothetical protein